MTAVARERVLVVDDEPQVLIALEDLLSERFIVLKTGTAQQALRILEQERDVAVVITDQRMPRMNGDEFLARLGSSSDALRILLTGYANLSAVVNAVNEGRIFAYVTKPWDPDDLLLRVDKAAEHFRLARELAHERELLRERTGILNAVLDSVGDGVVVSDSQGDFLLFNRQAERLLGTSPGQTSLATWTETCGVYLPDASTRIPAELDPFVRGMSERTELEVLIRNGATSDAIVTVTTTPFRREGALAGSVALLHDATERRLLERQLVQAQKMEAIGELAGGVAHDFNNLLTVIHGCGEVIRNGLTTGDPKRDEVDQLLEAARRASTLTKQLLALGRRDLVKPKLLDLNAVLSNVEGMLRRAIGTGIDLAIERTPSLGRVRADEGQVEQVILNLVINARDAMPDGGTLTIETEDVRVEASPQRSIPPRAPGSFVMLAVSDTGSGMDKETQLRVFEPFFTTKGPLKGTGLGLSTVYGIVQRSGGYITVQSELGRGTRFEVFLPRDDGSI
jgi:PAS domain S-box-containing protein